MKKIKIIQLGAKIGSESGLGWGNAGDTAVGNACSYVYRNEFNDCEITYLNCRQIFEEKHIDEINAHDILIVSGGGLFLKDTFPNNISDWQWGISVELLNKIQIPIIVYGIGYNKFRGQEDFSILFNKSVEALVEKSIFFSMRNSGSCNSIKKHITKQLHSKISLNFCPTIIYKNNFPKNIIRTKSVGFLLAGDRLVNRHKNLDQFILQIKEFTDYLKKLNIKTILINHQNDEWISKFIKFDEFKNLYKKSPDEIYNFYSSIDTVIADRGHGQMIPFSCGCKIISPVSHEKLNWFLQDLGLPDLGIDENDDNLGKKLIKKYDSLSIIDWSKIYESKMEQICENYKVNFALIKSKLNFQAKTVD